MGWRGRSIGAGATALLLVTVAGGQADAHSCAEPVTIEARREVTVELAVTVGLLPTDDITFQLPDDIEVVGATDVRGWQVDRTDRTVRYRGGPLDPDTCVPFEIVLRATEPGLRRVRVLQRLEDGSVVEHPAEGDIYLDEEGTGVAVDRTGIPNPAFEQVIEVTEAPATSSATGLVLVASAVTALAGAAWWWARRRRPDAVPDAGG